MHALMPTPQRLAHVQHANTAENRPPGGRLQREGPCEAYHDVPRQRRAARLCGRRVHTSDPGSCKRHATSTKLGIMVMASLKSSFSTSSAQPASTAGANGAHGARQRARGRASTPRASPRHVGGDGGMRWGSRRELQVCAHRVHERTHLRRCWWPVGDRERPRGGCSRRTRSSRGCGEHGAAGRRLVALWDASD